MMSPGQSATLIQEAEKINLFKINSEPVQGLPSSRQSTRNKKPESEATTVTVSKLKGTSSVNSLRT